MQVLQVRFFLYILLFEKERRQPIAYSLELLEVRLLYFGVLNLAHPNQHIWIQQNGVVYLGSRTRGNLT